MPLEAADVFVGFGFLEFGMFNDEGKEAGGEAEGVAVGGRKVIGYPVD